MLSFGAVVESSGDGSQGSFCPCGFSPSFNSLLSSSPLNSAYPAQVCLSKLWKEAMDECACQVGWGLWSCLASGDHLLWLCPGTTVLLSLRAPPCPITVSPVGNLSQAMENVLSVLLFYPEDEPAKKALNEYQAQLGEPRPGLGPREVILCSILTLNQIDLRSNLDSVPPFSHRRQPQVQHLICLPSLLPTADSTF